MKNESIYRAKEFYEPINLNIRSRDRAEAIDNRSYRISTAKSFIYFEYTLRW